MISQNNSIKICIILCSFFFYLSFGFSTQVQIKSSKSTYYDIALRNLLNDLGEMRKSRESKFRIKDDSINNRGTKKSILRHALIPNNELSNLYLNENHYYFTNITKIVGPMNRGYVLDMILTHPKLIAKVLTHSDETDCKQLRSVYDQIINDLNISSLSHKIRLKKFPLEKMNRRNVRRIFQLFYELGMTTDFLSGVILKAPQLLSYSSVNIQKSIKYLQNEGLTNEGICKMIHIRPMILAGSTREGKRMDLIFRFLQKDLNIDSKKLFYRYPQVLELKADGLIEKARFLSQVLKLRRWNDVSSVISTFPPLLWLSESNVQEKVNFLEKEFELDDDDLRDIIVTYPQIMGLSVEKNLKLKVDFMLSEHVALTRIELKDLVLYQPALLAYSLEGRIKPRLCKLQENSISFSYAPPYLMSLSDSKFEEWLEVQISTWSIKQ